MRRILPIEARKNQRVSTTQQRRRQHLLDVKVRSQKATAQRNRFIVSWVCRLVIIGGILACAVIGTKMALKKFLWNNPDFRIGEITVKTDGSLTRDEILQHAGIIVGENIFLVKLNAAHDRLADLPQVQHAQIERRLPNQITILVEERHPIARVAGLDDGATMAGPKYVADAQGTMMRMTHELPEYYRLPVIRGVTVANLADGQTVTTPEVRAALQLLDLNMDNPRLRIRAIDVSKAYCLLVTDDTQATYTFGLEHVSDQIDRLNRVFDYADFNKQQIQTVNLLVQRNVPVTFVQSGDNMLDADDSEADAASAPGQKSAKGKPVKRATAAPSPKSHATPVKKRSSHSTHHG